MKASQHPPLHLAEYVGDAQGPELSMAVWAWRRHFPAMAFELAEILGAWPSSEPVFREFQRQYR